MKNHKPNSVIRIKPEARKGIDRVSKRYRLTITEAVSVVVEAFEAMTPDEQLRVIAGIHKHPTPEANAA